MSDVQRHNRLVKLRNRINQRNRDVRRSGQGWANEVANIVREIDDLLDENAEEIRREGRANG